MGFGPPLRQKDRQVRGPGNSRQLLSHRQTHRDRRALRRQRQHRCGAGEGARAKAPRRPSSPIIIEGELVAKSTGATSLFAVGERVFHLKFGNGNVTAVDGNKLTIRFDKAGEKRVVDSFVERV
jgi:DNA helicase-2/ATP-dependent DNA helicase PcrA